MYTQSLAYNTAPHFITLHEPLASKNWFQTGGPAKLYAQPTTAQQFSTALAYAHEHSQPIFLLGNGANILIADEGFDGMVIHPRLTQITHDGEYVTAGAGVSIADLIAYCLDHNLLGLEEFSGIPGTVGGAMFINLHYFEFLFSQFVHSATIVHQADGSVETVDTSWFNFGYDISRLHDKKQYLINATFKLARASDIDTSYARGRSAEIIRHRARRYPQSHTCGSFFRNFHSDEVSLEINGTRMIYVAYYLDKIGVKGNLAINGASVSYQHANMIVNTGKARTADIVAVARTMQMLVQEQFGIIPQPECQLIGFTQWPLVVS